MAPRSVTTWSRLEPRTRDVEMLDGLQNAIHDPLWLLGRQWQTGELDGDDAGSLIDASLELAIDPMTRFRSGGVDGDGADVVYSEEADQPPLETLVEHERVRYLTGTSSDDPGDGSSTGSSDDEGGSASGLETDERRRNVRLAAESGAHFQRLVAVHTDIDGSVSSFPESLRLEAEESDDGARRFTSVVAGRTLDGDELYERYAFAGVEEFLTAVEDDAVPLPRALEAGEEDDDVSDDDLEEFWNTVVSPYREWYEECYREPTDGEVASCWDDDRLEYSFAVSTGHGETETVLEADGYEGGRLDWFAVDVAQGATLGETGDEPDSSTVDQSLVPARSTFPGMPAERWWEFEDDGLDLSALEAAPEDLSRLLLLEFALVYGNDWFTIPVDLPVGSLTHVEDFELETSFNETVTVDDAAIEDDDETATWNMYSFALDGDEGDGPDRGLFLPPVLEGVLESDAIEEVTFGRDETANVAWAVEKSIEGAVGQARDRATETATESRTSKPVASSEEADVSYQLSTDVPANWFPMLPRRGDELDAVTFDLGRLYDADEEQGDPEGRVLDGVRSIPEAEVPRTGKTVTRSYALSRWSDGTTHCWSGRRASVGREKTGSGLAFDVLVDPVAPTTADAVGDSDPFPDGLPSDDWDDGTDDGPDENGDTDDGHVGGEDGTDDETDGSNGSDTGEPGSGDGAGGDGSGGDGSDGDRLTDTEPLAIVDLSYDTPGGPRENLEAEFVALENVTDESLDLAGWRVEDRVGHTYVFDEPTTLEPGATLYLRTGAGTDTATDRYWGRRMQVWNALGDTVVLVDDDGDVRVEYTYPERPPDVRDGPLEVLEVQADTPGPIWENLDQEFVVFENDGGEPLDVSGWRVSEQAGFTYEFPEGTVIPPGETVTLVTGIGTDTETTYHWGYRRPIWNRRGDTVSVFDADEHLVLRRSY